jgi:protein-S-isoprenylcysteine O-methyltransferase Ste14
LADNVGMDAPRRPVWGRSLAGLALVTAAVFGAAGRIDYWQGWIFVGLTAASLGLTYFFLRKNPDLVAERARPGRGVKWWDKLYYLLSTPLWFASIIVACLDEGRGHWAPDPPRGLYAAAVALFVLGQGLYLWAKAVNPFFSSVARIQADRGQTVCREGPYRLCRHPGYLGGVLFGLATPVVLGSYWALLPQAAAIALLVVRTLLEDRMLTRDLLWYAEYKRSVPSLLVPGLW